MAIFANNYKNIAQRHGFWTQQHIRERRIMKAKNINTDRSRQEITKNIPGFPVSCYLSEFTSGTYDHIDWHWHVEFQLCLTISGAVVWNTGNQQITADAGEGIFINSRCVHMARPCSEDTVFFCLDFPPDFLCTDKKGDLYKESVLPVSEETGLCGKRIDRQIRQGAEILDILRNMAEDFEEKAAGYEFEIAGNVLRIWKRLRSFLGSDIRRETGSADDRFREMLMYLQRHYSGNITLDEIAAYTGISRSECCRYFRKKSGQTIFGYLNRYRIHKSMELMAGTDGDIAQTAQECGFSDQSYYTKKFREQTGMTPGQYRLMERQKEKPSP